MAAPVRTGMLLAADLTLIVLWARVVLACGLGIWSCRRRSVPVAQRTSLAHVAVVVPAFNEARAIAGTLRSLLDHEPRPREIIVVDDGSTDATSEVACSVLAGVGGARVISLPVNAGKAAALNAGVAACTAPIIATIDADTRLEAGAITAALAAMRQRRAVAVAFYLDAEHDNGLLGMLQQQEYVASLNIERAWQDDVGAISVLPGAATLFRRQLLLQQHFSNRSRTEDADLTLSLARRGARIVLARDAVALTQVPTSWGELLAQRIRWTTGHLQCSVFQASDLRNSSWRFQGLVFPNFVLSTWMPPAALAALLVLWTGGRGELLGLGVGDAASVSVALVYAQRGATRLVAAKHGLPWRYVLLEPAVTSIIGTLSFACAIVSMLGNALSARFSRRGRWR